MERDELVTNIIMTVQAVDSMGSVPDADLFRALITGLIAVYEEGLVKE